VPSTSVGVTRDGGLAWYGARGTVDGRSGSPAPTADTQYRIGSITKTFTGVLIMRLRDEGALALDDRVEQHLPGTRHGDVTVRQLLSHTAGLAAEPPGVWWERSPGRSWDDLAASFDERIDLYAAGRRFHYSNPGYAMLGQIVARARGMTWFEALRREVLEPLGLSRTTYDPVAPAAPGIAVHPWADVVQPEVVQDLGDMAAAGQLWSTARDLGVWAAFLAGSGPSGSDAVLASDTIAEMREPNVITEGPEWSAGYGLGLQVFKVNGREYVGHGGSVPGFLAFLLVDPERRTGSVELANATSGAAFTVTDLLDLLEKHEPTIPPAWAPAAAVPDGTLDIVGTWYWGTATFTVSLRGSETILLAPIGGKGRASRFVQRDGAWTGLDGYWLGEQLRVIRAPDGSVSHLDLGHFVFVRQPYDRSAPIPGGVDERGWRPVDD
jgi:CubicO group peptidase (beta-lactamase class C family)